MWLALLINVLAFLIGGFIVGIKSAGRTIIEPGISAVARNLKAGRGRVRSRLRELGLIEED